MNTHVPKLGVLVLVLGVCSLGLQAQEAPLDATPGLLGLRLGQALDSVPVPLTPKKGKARGAQRYLAQPPEGLKAGLALLREVVVFGYKGYVIGLDYKTGSLDDSHALLAYLEELFGPGAQDGYAPRYRWKTHTYQLLYDRNLFTGEARATFEYLQE